MKQVWVKAPTWSRTAATTRGEELPTLTTAMPAPRSISELPSTPTSTPPPARSPNTGRVLPTPADTVAPGRGAPPAGGPGRPAAGRQLARAGAGDLGDQPTLLRGRLGVGEQFGHGGLP